MCLTKMSNNPFYWFIAPTIPKMQPCVTSFPLKFLAQVLFILGRGFSLRPWDKRGCLANKKMFPLWLLFRFVLVFFFLSPTAQLHVNIQGNKITSQRVANLLTLSTATILDSHCRKSWTKCALKRVCSQVYTQNSSSNAGYKANQTNKKGNSKK